MAKYELNVMEKDALIEMASIGTGNASTVLSDLVNKEVFIKTPTVDVIKVKDLSKAIGSLKKMPIGYHIYVGGDLKGAMMVVSSKKDMLLLDDLMRSRAPGTTKELEHKTLSKVADSLSTTYVNAISKFLGLTLYHSGPAFIHDFEESIIRALFFTIEKTPEYIILLQTELKVNPNIKGKFIFLLAIDSIDRFMELMKKKAGE